MTAPKKRRRLHPVQPWVFPPLNPALFPGAVPVPAGVYQGLCRTLLEIEIMLGLAHCVDVSLAVQVGQTQGDEAVADWIREHPADFQRGCGAGFQEFQERRDSNAQ